MNELQIIEEREVLGKEFRIYGDFENPLFLAKDVAEWIDYDVSNVSKMVNNVDENEKIITRINNTSATFLTEDGLYEVLMLSRKPIAKEFKKQVKEILKTIRKTGMYATDELLNNPDLAIKAFTRLKEEQEKRMQLEKQIEEQAPSVLFAKAVSTANTSILVGEQAKILKQNGYDTGEKRFFVWLRENGYLISRKGNDWNMPTQKSMNLGLFEIKETVHQQPNGSVKITKTPKITGKGQQYFVNKFLGNEVIE